MDAHFCKSAATSLALVGAFLFNTTNNKLTQKISTCSSSTRSSPNLSLNKRKGEQDRMKQLLGFKKCLSIWCERNFRRCLNESQDQQLLNSIQTKCAKVPVKELAKWFKYQLASNFSFYNKQEMPISSYEFFMISTFFSGTLKKRVHCGLNRTNSKRLRYTWDLMQSKSLSAMVPKGMIQDAYEKHHKTMGVASSVVDDKLLSELKDFVRPYCLNVRKLYSDVTTLPTNHSCFEASRSLGGQHHELSSNLIKMSGVIPYSGDVRIDPVVIHLEGPPGVGKSHSVSKLTQRILQRFGKTSEDVYSRSAAVEHWDGYKQQFITIIDDIGMKPARATSESDDFAELYQLCSNVDVILPMAKLNEKGMKFNSHFLILTSNFASQQPKDTFTSMDAINRRLSPTFRIGKEVGSTELSLTRYDYKFAQNLIGVRAQGEWKQTFMKTNSWNENLDFIVDDSIIRYEQKRNSMSCKETIIQSIPNSDLYLQYNSPPEYLSSVSTYAIPEPLKVRMITRPEKDAFVLKPLQKAMFNSLKMYSCFQPCWDSNYNLNSLLQPGKKLLSGDYTAATDELNFNISQAVISEIRDAFSDLPLLQQWISYEGGSHLVHYPEYTGLCPVIQSNGQLMGSLLSFPILCLVNAFTMCKAQNKSLETVQALFHGDDIAAAVTDEEFLLWKENAANCGLSLSIGKNYLSEDFVSIDSKLFINNGVELVQQKVGKYKLLIRDESGLTCKSALENNFPIKMIVKYNQELLKATPESLDVSHDFGGLNVKNIKEELGQCDYAVYRAKLYSKVKVRDLGNNLYSLPSKLALYLNLRKGTERVDWVSEISDPNFIFQFRKELKELKVRRIQQKQFVSLVPLSTISKEVVHCVNYSIDELQLMSNSLLGYMINPPLGKVDRLKHFSDRRSVKYSRV